MATDRIRSMVPLFGGSDKYVETLNRTLQYIASAEPTHGELINWHRDHFDNVQSQGSIERRLRYIQNLDLIQQDSDGWRLDTAGQRYLPECDRAVLFDIMAERNVGLQSLLFELADRPMTIDEVNEFLLTTNEVLGWDPTKTDMAKQRVNWLRSLDLVERRDDTYHVTVLGQQFIDEIQAIRSVWKNGADSDDTATSMEYTAAEYHTTAYTRSLDPEFRAVVLHRHDTTCPISGVDHARLLDVAHVLPWAEYPEHRADFGNVLPLGKTHHAAFDADLFTLDEEFRVRVNPDFQTDSKILRNTLVDQEGTQVKSLSQTDLQSRFLKQRNDELGWM